MKYYILEKFERYKWLVEQTDKGWDSIFHYENGKYVKYKNSFALGNIEDWAATTLYTSVLTPTTLEQFIADNFTDML